jgi:hypothetical protein
MRQAVASFSGSVMPRALRLARSLSSCAGWCTCVAPNPLVKGTSCAYAQAPPLTANVRRLTGDPALQRLDRVVQRMTTSPHKLFREVLAEANDPLAAIRAVREVFGLTVDQAKEVWLQATGISPSLTEHQEKLASTLLQTVCPSCRSSEAVGRKMHALPVGLGYSSPETVGSPSSQFVYGFWCNSCQIGFVPNHLLDELGLEQVRGV